MMMMTMSSSFSLTQNATFLTRREETVVKVVVVVCHVVDDDFSVFFDDDFWQHLSSRVFLRDTHARTLLSLSLTCVSFLSSKK